MSKVLSLQDWKVRQVLRSRPEFVSRKSLARGCFCAVYEAKNPESVLKLTTDPSHYSYLTDRLAPQGSFKPVVRQSHGIVGETANGLDLYLLEVERLYSIKRSGRNREIIRYINANSSSWRNELPSDPWLAGGVTEDMVRFMYDLTIFTSNFLCELDIHSNNFMERANGELVFNDPVYDSKVMQRHWSGEV